MRRGIATVEFYNCRVVDYHLRKLRRLMPASSGWGKKEVTVL